MSPRRLLAVLILTLVLTLAILVSAQAPQATTPATNSKTKMLLAGQLEIALDFQAVENNSFSYTPVQPLMKGDVVAAMVSEDQAWSINTAGERQSRQDEKGYPSKGRTSSRELTAVLATYPVVAMVKTSDGKVHSLYPAIFKAKTDIKAGDVVDSEGYQIETRRSVKAEEPVPVLIVEDGTGRTPVASAILSLEAALSPALKPSLAAFQDSMKQKDRASAIEAWRTEKEHVANREAPS